MVKGLGWGLEGHLVEGENQFSLVALIAVRDGMCTQGAPVCGELLCVQQAPLCCPGASASHDPSAVSCAQSPPNVLEFQLFPIRSVLE